MVPVFVIVYFMGVVFFSAEINSEISSLLSLAANTIRDRVKIALTSNNVGTETQQSVLKDMNTSWDPFSETFQKFRNSKQIEKYLTTNFKVIAPETKALGEGTFQYVSPIKVLNKIAGDRSFQECLKMQRAVRKPDSECIRDLHDGMLYRENSYFKENPDAFG